MAGKSPYSPFLKGGCAASCRNNVAVEPTSLGRESKGAVSYTALHEFLVDTLYLVRPTEGPSWGYPVPGLGAVSPFLEPFCCGLLSKSDKPGKN